MSTQQVILCSNVGDSDSSPLPPQSLDDEKTSDEKTLSERSNEIWLVDRRNPRNWPSRKKWTSAAIVSFYTFLSPLASSMMAPGLPELAQQYQITDPTITALTLSIFLISFGIGPLVLGPLSEMYGRAWVLHTSNLAFLCFNLGCALAPTTDALLAFRFLAGFVGSAPIACGGACISDVFAEHERASAMSVFTLGPLLGPIIGPIAGGFIAQSIGMKYVFVVIVGLSAVAALLGIPLFRETYAPVIRLRAARKVSSPDAEQELLSDTPNEWKSKLRILWLHLSRPVLLLTRSPICFMLSLYMALQIGIYYLMFATFAELFSSTYGFSPGVGGLAYIGLGIGFVSAALFGAKFSDRVYVKLAAKNGNKGTPEMRIPALICGSLFVPVGLFWYGWTAQAKAHWILPIIGTGIFGFGLMTTNLPIQLYLVDAFTYAASAMSGASLFRSLLGFAFPLFGQQMYNALGYGAGNSLLAGLAIGIGIPFPIWIYYNGERLRQRSRWTR